MRKIILAALLLFLASTAWGATKQLSYDPANVDANGIAAALTTDTDWSLSGDAEWLLSSAGDSLAHRLVITTAGNEPAGNGPTMTLTGTDADNHAITDSVVLPNATTIETAKYFKTVTSATTGANATVGLIDIGWVDEIVSPSIRLDENYQSNWHLDVTGTISIDTDFLIKDWTRAPRLSDQNAEPWLDAVVADLDAETADSATAVVVPEGYRWMRFRVNSYTDTAEFDVHFSHRVLPRAR